MTGPAVKGYERARRFAQPSLGPVADHRTADLARGGEADADQGLAVGPVASLDHDRAAGRRQGFGGGQEIRPLAQAFDRK